MDREALIVFGAFDRHNFGDLLFPHVAAALLPDRELLFAGVARRDLRSCGGHAVAAIGEVAEGWGERPVDLLHAGGEILTVDAWQAAVMLLPPEDVAGVIGLYRDDPAAGLAWARDYLGRDACAAYVVPRRLFRRPRRWLFAGVGGVGLERCDPRLGAEVGATLRASDFVGVRDGPTAAALRAAGVAARLMPDPAVLAAELFGERIRTHGAGGEPAAVRAAFPQGYVALQFSADFGDATTLALISAQLDRVAAATGFGIVLFRAGAAPWHDDLDAYRRAASRMLTSARLFESLNPWDVCALIAGSRGYCGSSLHGRILALAYGLPRVSLVAAGGRPGKLEAFVDTWDSEHPGSIATPERIAAALLPALGAGADGQRRTAARLAALYRDRFGELRAILDAQGG
jgi:hypothetical protein